MTRGAGETATFCEANVVFLRALPPPHFSPFFASARRPYLRPHDAAIMPDDAASAPCASRLSAALASARARAVALAAAARAALAARRGEDAWSPRELAAAAPVTDDIVLTCAAGVRARVCRAGCAVRALELPDGTDVVLGHEDTVKYLVRGRGGEGGGGGREKEVGKNDHTHKDESKTNTPTCPPPFPLSFPPFTGRLPPLLWRHRRPRRQPHRGRLV